MDATQGKHEPTSTSVIVSTLVERFRENREAYLSSAYNETQLRQEFLDPFFKALGWDVDNEQGYAEAYKDVIHEDAIKVGGATKAPDYAFRIGGTRKFFVEAKRPSIGIKDDPDAAYQLRRYAWSAKLPLSILTDFEEFAVYDCRVRPNKDDKASTARTLYFTYDQYGDEWDEIAGIFARKAILKGSFDKYVEAKKKRGTAEVDDAFLKEIEGWRDVLARNIAIRNTGLSNREVNFAVQRTIDRIIFLRICEDRGIEPYGQLMALRNGHDVYRRLCQVFRNADDRYNSGLFHFRREKGRDEAPDELTLNLQIDDKVLKDVFKDLYYPDSPYEFSVLPADILGHIYEQFLGKVIRLTPAHRAVVEDKPEVKKAGGVYYTPTYIVDYIVQHTVERLMEDKTPNQVAKLRILDPACGSGSFLLGTYQRLLDWHLDWYSKHEPEKHAKGHKPKIFQGPGGDWRLTTAEKKRVLLNNIYGVDIDPQAVEVTKLSLLLKVLEGESEETLGKTLRMFHERALPDLGENIKCGNSLIGPDFYEGKQLSLIDEEEWYRINAFDWNGEFPEIMAAGGFDVVIGNPPYGADLSELETHYMNRCYRLQDYQLDSYLLFVEKSLDLMARSGFLGMIIPNTWLLNLSWRRFRSVLFEEYRIESIVHHGRPVFPKATVNTEILVLAKALPAGTHKISITIVNRDRSEIRQEIAQGKWQRREGAPINVFERDEFSLLVGRMRKMSTLDELCVITQGTKPFQVGKGKPPQTRQIVTEKPYVSDTKQDGTFCPLLRGSMIQRYQISWTGQYWISLGDWLAEPRYSANYDAPEKIVIRQTGDSLVATLDEEQFVVRDNLYTVVPRVDRINLRHVLGILNSQLLNWYYQWIINPERGEALAQVKRGHLAQLPIAVGDGRDLTELVEAMRELKENHAAAKAVQDRELLQRQIDAADKQIDQLVYELYGLTGKEIRIVEEAMQ